MFNTDRVFIRRLILEEYVPYIEYIQHDKNIVAYTLPISPIKRNKETKQESTYKRKLCHKPTTPNNYLKVSPLLIKNWSININGKAPT